MARSFFRGTDAELYTGSDNFSTLLTASPLVYGVSVLAAADYATKNTAWRTAYEAAITPETRTKAKVAAKNAQRAIIRAAASALAKIIDGTLTVTDEQKIELGLNVRAIPAPRPAPGQPNTFKAMLVPGEAALEITWSCANPPGTQGTIYQVYRQTTPGEWVHLGDSGLKKFIDATVPAAAQLTYKVRGLLSTVAGLWGTFVVTFGAEGFGGAKTASVAEPAPKLAA
jgi:hypothetical protein